MIFGKYTEQKTRVASGRTGKCMFNTLEIIISIDDFL